MRTIGTTRRVLLAVAALGACCALAACGSSSSSSSSSTSSSASTTGASARRSALATCLRQHGVTLPNRPPGGGPPAGGAPGGRFFGGGGAGAGRFANPKFRAAFQACGGTARFRNGARFRLSRTKVQSYVSCVRKHGFPQMPSPNFSGKAPVFPASVRTNSKFQFASRQCQSILIPARSGTATGTTT